MLPLLVIAALSLSAEERDKSSDWPVHAELKTAGIGAEYMVRSVMHPTGNFVVRDFLVVEVAIYPAKGEALLVSQQQFTLRINGKKAAIFPQTPGMVAASAKYEDWERRPGMTATAGPLIFGRPRSSERFPGDPRPGQERLPNPPQAPQPEDRTGVDKQQQARPEDVIVQAALPEGAISKPTRGLLYFAQRGKAESFKKIELVYSGSAGETVLALK
jgi:hypothetical protein